MTLSPTPTPTLETPAEQTLTAAQKRPCFNWRAAAPRLVAVAVYAVAMAYVESAAVLYLRTIYGGIDPVGPRRSPFDPLPDFVAIEVDREAATMLMLLAVGYLAASTQLGRVGAFAMAMGIWDIFYYVFVWLFAGWPGSPLAPDILFLIPLPWWGPVAAPVMLAVGIVVTGGIALAREMGDGIPSARPADVLALLAGVGLCLIAFMRNAMLALPAGLDAAFSVRGGPFPWPVYALGVALCGFGLVRALTRVAS